jgi:hypothetical protein
MLIFSYFIMKISIFGDFFTSYFSNCFTRLGILPSQMWRWICQHCYIVKITTACFLQIMPCDYGNFTINYDICDFLQNIDTTLILVLSQIIFIPIFTIIVITLIDQDREDAKWFIFNTAVLNLIFTISEDVLNFFPKFYYNYVILINNIFCDLAQYSMLLLAVTRVLVLYSERNYQRFFSRKILFCWIVGYDLVLLGIIYFYYTNWTNVGLTLHVVTVFSALLGTLSCSCLVLLKIRQMISLVKHNSELTVLYDLRRAAIVCILQASIYVIYIIVALYYHFYNLLGHQTSSSFVFAMKHETNLLGL